jgi:cytochrome c553
VSAGSIWLLALSAATAASTPATVPDRHTPLLKEYCQGCHGPEKQKGKLRIDELPLAIETLRDAERWQKVLNQMNSGEMPPEEEKQPPKELKADLLEDLANTTVSARRNFGDQKGVITMRRLNRRE